MIKFKAGIAKKKINFSICTPQRVITAFCLLATLALLATPLLIAHVSVKGVVLLVHIMRSKRSKKSVKQTVT